MTDSGITKLYYSISEVAEMTDLEPHVLRYWESEFDILEPRKNRAGRRVYTADDIETVRLIKHLLKVDKYTIEGARQALERRKQREEGVPDEHKKALLDLRVFLEKVLKTL